MRITLLSAAILLSAAGISQEISNEIKPVSDLKSGKSETAEPITLSTNLNTKEEGIHAKYVWKNGQVTQVTKESELANTQNLLQALNDKEAFLKSNPKTMNSPENLTWYAQAASLRLKFEAKIAELSE